MPKIKYPKELKIKVLTDYEECKDAKLVAQRHGITPNQVWQWKAVENARPRKEEEKAFRALKKKNLELETENALLREIVKKTAMVMPLV